MTTQEAINIVLDIARDWLETADIVTSICDSREQAQEALEVVGSIRIPMNTFEAARLERKAKA